MSRRILTSLGQFGSRIQRRALVRVWHKDISSGGALGPGETGAELVGV